LVRHAHSTVAASHGVAEAVEVMSMPSVWAIMAW
jgi:hypothetical protein